ncbi:dermonecrotic toxin domain-containing protein [Pseudomonas juntendi]|uniref:dermonecrotic toxin domain-containing protein n=1 Tax=Pseudomonas juntendi TaxID=2666183 RepID=UPI003209C25B
MNDHETLSLAQVAQRLLGQFPDLHGLARQAAGHVLRRQLGYWLDPDGLYWHEFQSATSSSLSFTGWRHSGPPRRSLTLTELVIQRYSPQQQASADELSIYGGFYRVDASHAVYDQRNEVRLDPQHVLKAFWRLDFAGRYTEVLGTFRARHGEDYCVLARARFIAAVGQAGLSEPERHELMAVTLAAPALPTTVRALRLAREASAQSGWNALVIGGISAKLMFLRKLKTGRLCLYLADVQAVVQVFDDRHAFQEWMADQAATTVGRERLVRLFVGDGVLAQALRPRLRNYFKLLAQSRGDTAILGQPIEGDLFVRLRDAVMDDLTSDAHERLTTNAQLRKADWLAGVQAASFVIAPMAPFGWPVILASLGLGTASLVLHLDRAINGKQGWRTAAWWSVLTDILFILLDIAMLRASELFTDGHVPPRVAGQAQASAAKVDWGLYMAPAADELLAVSDQALARQEALLGAVPWADLDALGPNGEYLDAFSEPYPVYRDEHGFGSPAIAEYTSSPERYNNLWRGMPLEGTRAAHIQRSHALAHALGQIGVTNQVRLYRAASGLRGTGFQALGEGAIEVGDVLVTTDFTSFTENPYALWEVFNDPQAQVSGRSTFDENALVYVLEPGEDMQATPIGPFSRRPDEVESLMMPGRYLQVQKVTAVQGHDYRFTEVCLKALAQAPGGTAVRDMRTGKLFDRQALAMRLGKEDDSLMRTFFALPA